MPNEYENSYTNQFQILKTRKKISEINEYISDRLIITHEGKMYFEFSDEKEERIPITVTPESYLYRNIFSEVNSIMDISFDKLYNFEGETLVEKQIINFTTVYDSKGNIGIITEVDKVAGICKVLVLTNVELLIQNYINIYRHTVE